LQPSAKLLVTHRLLSSGSVYELLQTLLTHDLSIKIQPSTNLRAARELSHPSAMTFGITMNHPEKLL
jgi:hypothetical protein